MENKFNVVLAGSTRHEYVFHELKNNIRARCLEDTPNHCVDIYKPRIFSKSIGKEFLDGAEESVIHQYRQHIQDANLVIVIFDERELIKLPFLPDLQPGKNNETNQLEFLPVMYGTFEFELFDFNKFIPFMCGVNTYKDIQYAKDTIPFPNENILYFPFHYDIYRHTLQSDYRGVVSNLFTKRAFQDRLRKWKVNNYFLTHS